ncbi:collagen alpha-1(xii) chain [Plakobranchus ocellatus]|uniref:Collagen alpha-1(Xii) chain n=1 Tax=Plakobranchus ocellatus TaxID=259542 RepID=A0AAV3Y6F5_9GAST|nr:collagen alpha-1(xii) chain [Plakobranchus ocellatus]
MGICFKNVISIVIFSSSCCSIFCMASSNHSSLGNFSSSTSACPGKEMDIFFLLDSSTSIWVVHYLEHLKFVRDLVQRLDVSSAYTRVGVLSFSDKYKNPSVLRLTGSRNVVEEINIDNLPYLTGLTYTDKAIRYVRQLPIFRRNTVKVMVVLTNGESRDRAATTREAKLARRAGFYIFVVGMGIYTNTQEWRAIASDPDESFMWNVTNYQNLSNVANDLLHRVCYLTAINNTNFSKPHLERTKACRAKIPAILSFIAGESNPRRVLDVVGYVAENIDDRSKQVLVNFLMPSCPSKMTSGSVADFVSCSPKLVTQNRSPKLTQYLQQVVEINEDDLIFERVTVVFMDYDGTDAEHIDR